MRTHHFTRCFVAVVALFAAAQARADNVTDPAFNRFRSQVVGSSVQFSYGSGGTPLAGGSSATGIGVASGVDVSRGVAIPTKHGPIIGTLSQKISSGSMGKAVGRLASAGSLGTPVGLAFLAAPFVIDWFASGGMTLPGGVPSIPEVQHPTYTDAYEYQYGSSAWSLSIIPACNAWIASFPDFQWSAPTYLAPSSCQSNRTTQFGSSLQTQVVSRRARTSNPLPPQQLPATSAQIESRLSSVTNPTPEAMAELYKLGGQPNLDTAHPIPDLVDTLRAEFEARSPESVESTTTETPTETKTTEKTCATYTEIIGSTLYLREDCGTTTTTQPKDPVTGEPVGDPIVETETKTGTTPDPAVKPETETASAVCGGPGLPDCGVKVNETGTPTGQGLGQSNELDSAFGARLDGLSTARDAAGDASWGIVPAWTQDEACAPWEIFTLPDAVGGSDVTVNLCPLMPIAEGILNFIWAMLGIFAVTSMVSTAMTGKGT